MADDPAPVPQLRASDADRERVADLLRHAAGEGRLDVDELDERLTTAYGARTRAELEPLVADVVPGDGGHFDPVPRPAGRMPVRRDGAKGTSNIISIMGGSDRSGSWRLAERVGVTSIMGGADLDLNDAELSADVTLMTVFSLMGGADIYVPEHLNVEVTSIPIMGGNEVELGQHHPDPGGPVLRMRLISIMGGASVKRGRKQSMRDKLEERRERRQERIDRHRGHGH